VAIPLSFIAGAIFLAAACTDIPTGANDVLSIEFRPLPAPAVVVGDTLRDSLGVVTPISLRAFNFQGDTILAPDVRFSTVDRGIRVDSLTGIVVGDSVRTLARILASVKGFNGIATLAVTLRPDSVGLANARDSLSYSLTDTTVNVSAPLSVKVLHRTATGDTAVNAWQVSFRITSPGDTALARLVNDAGARSSIDTTDATGIAGRKIRLDVTHLTTPIDSIIVQAFVKYRGINVRGSPARLVLKVKPK
jgi:hypothetical protein